jgi:hypothetical protein
MAPDFGVNPVRPLIPGNGKCLFTGEALSQSAGDWGKPARLRISSDIRSWEGEVPFTSHERALLRLANPLGVVSGRANGLDGSEYT